MSTFDLKLNVNETQTLAVEPLEDRQMLSSVTIFAAGEVGTEQMQLKINNEVVATYDVAGDAQAREFEVFQFDSENDIDITQIRVEFINDLYDPENGIDSNLVVDKVVLDGVTYESEHPYTYATSIYTEENGNAPGKYETETLNVNGAFRYSQYGASDPQVVTGTRFQFQANGTTGEEKIVLRVDGEIVEEYDVPSEAGGFFVFDSDEILTVDQFQIEFINDLYDPENGIDRNVSIFRAAIFDRAELEAGNVAGGLVDGVNATTYSTGSWTAEDGVVPGFGRGNTLHTNGYLQYSVLIEGPDLREALDSFQQSVGSGVTVTDRGVFTDDQGRIYRLATALNVPEVMIVRLADDSGDTRLDPTFGDEGLRIIETGENTEHLFNNRIAFDSQGNIGLALNVTRLDDITSGGSAGSVYQYSFLGTTLMKLTPDGGFDSSFGTGGEVFVPYTEDLSMLIPVSFGDTNTDNVSFDSEDRFVVSGALVGAEFQALRNSPSYSSYDQATLRFNGETFETFEEIDVE